MTIDGNLIRVNKDDEEMDCQLDSTFTATANVTTSQPCKGESRAETGTVSSTSWQIELNGKTDTTTDGNGVFELLDNIKNGDTVDVSFLSTGTLSSGQSAFLIEGEAIVSNVSIEAPADGESTYSATFIGQGDYTKTRTPVT